MLRFSSPSSKSADLTRRAVGASRRLARTARVSKDLLLCSDRLSHRLNPYRQVEEAGGTRLRVAQRRQGG